MQYPKSEAVDNVIARNIIYWNALWGNAIEIGFELNAAEIKNITFKNSESFMLKQVLPLVFIMQAAAM